MGFEIFNESAEVRRKFFFSEERLGKTKPEFSTKGMDNDGSEYLGRGYDTSFKFNTSENLTSDEKKSLLVKIWHKITRQDSDYDTSCRKLIQNIENGAKHGLFSMDSKHSDFEDINDYIYKILLTTTNTTRREQLDDMYGPLK